jgi:hypothetical protein
MDRECLDHAHAGKTEVMVPTEPGKAYDHSKRMRERRAVLDGAAELRRIVRQRSAEGTPVVFRSARQASESEQTRARRISNTDEVSCRNDNGWRSGSVVVLGCDCRA